jgi:pilus assembly protein CpaD
MRGFKSLAVLVVLAASVTGCASPAENSVAQLYSAEANFPIKVEPQVATLVVQVDEDGRGIAAGEEDGVRAFAEQWKSRGHGDLSITVPKGTANDVDARDAAADVAKILKSAGVDAGSIQVADYKGAANDANAPLTLSFVADTAVAAECGQNWSENMAFTPRNQPWPDFGCSTQHNLAAMVEDPRDLEHPHATDKADALRRNTVLQKYRAGEPTYTNITTKNDSGAVSDIKQ